MAELVCYECGGPIGPDDEKCRQCQALLVLYNEYPILGILQPESDNGIVYKSRHRMLQIDLVIKRAPARLAGYIRNEAHILQSLRRRLNFTPHVYDFRESGVDIALIMELIEGRTLDRVHPQQLWPVSEVEHFVEELLRHLEQLHEAGIIHRDLKPKNIIRRPDGSYALIDFNIAKYKDSKTEFSGFTRRYAPLEQIPDSERLGARQHRAPTDERSDLYSLAATAYELLTGQPPAPRPRPPSRLRPETISAALEQTLLAMLAARMADRPRSATVALGRLREAAPAVRTAQEAESPDASAQPAATPDASPDDDQHRSEPPPMAPPVISATEPARGQRTDLTVQTLPPEEGRGRITGIAWSPRDDRLAIATACGVRIYDAARGDEQLFRTTPTPVRYVGYALGGTALAFALDHTIEVRPVDTGQCLYVLPGYSEDLPWAVTYAPDGQTLALATDDTLSVVQIAQAQPLDQRSAVIDPRLTVSSQTGTLLATATDDSVTLWRLEHGALSASPLAGELPAPIVAMALSADGRMLAAASATAVHLWRSGRPLATTLRPHPQRIRQIALAPDGQHVAIVTETAIQIYSTGTDKPLRTISAAGIAADIFQVAFDTHGTRLAAASASAVAIWETGSGRQLALLKYTDNPRFLALAPDGMLLASAGRTVQVWQLPAQAQPSAVQIGRLIGPPRGVVLTQDSRAMALAAACSDAITVWRRRLADGGISYLTTARGASLGSLLPHDSPWSRLGTRACSTGQSHGLAFRRQGRLLQMARVARAGIDIWPISKELSDTVAEQAPLPTGDDSAPLYDIALAPDGWVAAASTDRVVRVWRVGDPATARSIQLSFVPNSIALAPGSQLLAAVADDGIQLWHVGNAEQLDAHYGPDLGAERVMFAPDGQTLAAVKRREIQIWRLEAGLLRHIVTAKEHTDSVTDVAFSADWRTFASASDDGTIKLWMYTGPARAAERPPDGGPDVPAVPPRPRPPARRLQIFLCHVSEDRERVSSLARWLQSMQFNTWDARQIEPGQNWQHSIRTQIEKADIFIAFLSSNFVVKQSYAKQEVDYALQIAEKLPTEQIYILPLRLDNCSVPEELRVWQWVDFFDDRVPAQLAQVLYKRAEEVAAKSQHPSNVAPLVQSREVGGDTSRTGERAELNDLLSTHRGALRVLQIQIARTGIALAPVEKILDLNNRRKEIRRIKGRMRELGIPYSDALEDGADGTESGTRPTNPR